MLCYLTFIRQAKKLHLRKMNYNFECNFSLDPCSKVFPHTRRSKLNEWMNLCVEFSTCPFISFRNPASFFFWVRDNHFGSGFHPFPAACVFQFLISYSWEGKENGIKICYIFFIFTNTLIQIQPLNSTKNIKLKAKNAIKYFFHTISVFLLFFAI